MRNKITASKPHLLMITRKVDKDDALAGFAHNWVKKLEKNANTLM